MRPDGYELRTTESRGEGVFATRSFGDGELVMVGIIERRVQENHSHATQVARSEYVLLSGLGPKVNHSCDPNCGIKINASGAPNLVARRFINCGEEITFDYAMRNYSIEHFPSGCRCGSRLCRGSVVGWKDLPDERKQAYEGLVSPYLLEIEHEMRARRKLLAETARTQRSWTETADVYPRPRDKVGGHG